MAIVNRLKELARDLSVFAVLAGLILLERDGSEPPAKPSPVRQTPKLTEVGTTPPPTPENIIRVKRPTG